MSDSDFGGFDSPAAVRSKPASGAYKPNSSRPQAGPSKASGGGAANASRKRAITIGESEDEGVQRPPVKQSKASSARARKQQEQQVEEEGGVAHDEDVVEVEAEAVEVIQPPQPKPKARAGSKKPASTNTAQINGKPTNNALGFATAKGKGKAKAAPKARSQSLDAMDIEEVNEVQEYVDVEEEEGTRKTNPVAAKPERSAARGIKIGRPPPRQPAKPDEVAQLQEQLAQANTHISDLKRQLDELLQVRHTEPEQLLERMEAQHQAQIRAQDSLVQDLKAKLAANDPLLKSGKKAVFELLTREEANKETEKLQQQLASYKEALKERDQDIKVKDDRIRTIEQETQQLQLELKVEIERGQALAAKAQRQPMGSASRPNTLTGPNKDPKLAEIIRFYEDLTNVIVPSIRSQPGRFLQTDEWVLNCCYTYKDVTDQDSIPKSLYFNLRLLYDLKAGATEPVVSMDQLVQSIHYIPRDLDKESPDFVESLGFLNDAFTFERNQLSIFLRQIHDNISGEGNDKDEADGSSDDDSVMVVQ